MESGNLNPACLPPETRVGPWRVLDLRGRGTYGAVYRAEAVDSEASCPAALKLALYARDARFDREVELLSLIRHPNVPRLLDRGHWQPPGGTLHPYLVMELVEGTPLYDWAREHGPSSRQVLDLLAGLARALEATHAVGGVHRDVKGDNVLVRDVDGQPFLMDFGSGHHEGASRLTWQAFPPGTPAYRSPEALRFGLHLSPNASESYAPGPADDVFALGVTAYRLVTQEYPPSTEPSGEESSLGHQEGSRPRPAHECNVRCCPELSALIARMLSPRPEVRGSARELAEAMKQAARSAGPKADVPLFVRKAHRPLSTTRPVPQRRRSRAPHRAWRPWLAAASLGGVLTLGAEWMLGARPVTESQDVRVAVREEARDGGTVAVGDSVLTAPMASTHALSVWSTIAVDMPPKPFPGQIRPDADGRCPRKGQIPLQGGCWLKLALDPKDCTETGYVYKDACYVPVFPPTRPATSSPAHHEDSR